MDQQPIFLPIRTEQGRVTPSENSCTDDQQPIVYVVDDDSDARNALLAIVESIRFKAVACQNAEEFLSVFITDVPSCLVTDLRMQGMSGLDLLQHLSSSGHVIPTIIVTGYAETEVAVDAMQAGAVTFLKKSAPEEKICSAILQGLRLDRRLRSRKAERDRVLQIWESITTEERRILRLVAEGKLNKEIAFEFGLPLRTIEDRRRRIMAKIKAASIVDLIRFAIQIEDLGKQEFPVIHRAS